MTISDSDPTRTRGAAAAPARGSEPRLGRSTLAVLAGGAAALLGTLGVRILFARMLNPAEVAVLLLGTAAVSAVGGVAGFGANLAATRRIARLRAEGKVAAARATGRTALLIGVAGGGAAASGLLLLAPVLAQMLSSEPSQAEPLTAILRACSPVALLLASGLSAHGVARAFGRVAPRVALRDAGGGLARLGAVALAAAAGASTLGFAAGFTAGVLVGEGSFALFVLRMVWRRGAGEPRFDPELLPRLPSFAGLEVLGQAQQWLDVLLLGALASPVELAFYGLARSLTRGLELVQTSAAHVFLPAATAAARDPASGAFAVLYQRARLLVLALCWAPLAGFLLAPQALTALLYGGRYAPSARLLAGLALAALIESVFGYKDLALIALGREGAVLRVQVLSVAAGAVVLVALVPPFGGAGAVAAVLVRQLLRTVAFAVLLRRAAGVRALADDAAGATGAALLLLVVGGGAVVVLDSATLSPVFVAALVAAAGALLLLRRSAALREPPAGA